MQTTPTCFLNDTSSSMQLVNRLWRSDSLGQWSINRIRINERVSVHVTKDVELASCGWTVTSLEFVSLVEDSDQSN